MRKQWNVEQGLAKGLLHASDFGGYYLTGKGSEYTLNCQCCAWCPFKEICEQEQIYFSCMIWAEDMGEDL